MPDIIHQPDKRVLLIVTEINKARRTEIPSSQFSYQLKETNLIKWNDIESVCQKYTLTHILFLFQVNIYTSVKVSKVYTSMM